MHRWSALIVSLGLIGCLFGLPAVAFAHETAVLGPATAVFHVDPDDDPIVGQPAKVDVLITHGDKPLELTECTCSLRVMDGRTSIGDFPLSPSTSDGLWTGSAPITFPLKSTYTLVLTGMPTHPDAFKPFTLRSVLPVRRTSPSQPAQPHDPDALIHKLHFLLPGAATVFLAYALIVQSRQRRHITSTAA